ncbi:MAG: transglycosylase SLT domain-containing protein, partial [Acidobacteriota bacterium]
EAMVLAGVARSIGAPQAERAFLERALESPTYGEVARIELAEMLVDTDAERAALLVLPSLEKAGSSQLREAAAGVARKSLLKGLSPELQRSIELASRRLPRSSRRAIEAVAADIETGSGRQTLRRLLERDRGDLPALEAARRFEALSDLSPREQWLVAVCLFRHALYEEAASALEIVAGSTSKDIPEGEAAFLRGRCAFRLDRWAEAERWYHRALKTASTETRRAEIQVHLARTRELAGDLDGAAEMARRAVVTKSSDDRRLLLIRLRLRQGRRDLADLGLAGLRSRPAKARGRVLMALHELAGGRTEEALDTLNLIQTRPWRGPVRVVAAGELARTDRPVEAVAMLEGAVKDLNAFWGGQARRVMASLPPEVIADWRDRQKEMVDAEGTSVGPALRRWAVLEFDLDVLTGIRKRLASALSIRPMETEPSVGGLAGDLWSIGLVQEAVRWDPGEFPVKPPEEGLWTVHQFLAGNSPWRAIRTAHAVWRSWGADLPMRAYPEVLEAAYYPVPRPDEVMKAADGGGIDWAIVAGVAREESRWNPGVLSVVGARGLMQLMPLTAAAVAARTGKATPTPEQLFEPEWSLELGAAELGRLKRSFGGFSAGAVAAYNAGEAQSHLWIEQCGADCDEARFVLTITFDVTRGYTEDVLASAETYRRLFPRLAEVDPRGNGAPTQRSE